MRDDDLQQHLHLPANTPCDCWLHRCNMTANDPDGLYGNIALVLDPQGEVQC